MKKIVGILGAAVMLASSVFAADMAAKVYMTGDLASGDADNGVNFFKLNAQDQKDADALVVSANGDKAGANFQFWYKYDGSGSANLVVRSTKLWFKPIDMVKITIGDVEGGGYTEQIHWWQAATGASLVQASAWDGRWSSYNTASGAGVEVEVTPISGLTAKLTVAPGTDKVFANTKADGTAAYGASLAYSFADLTGLPISAQLAWRDEGAKRNRSILAVGADYGAAFGAGFYGFLNARFYFDSSNADYSHNGDNKLRGICLDNYLKYSVGNLKVMACVPVTIRVSGEDGDTSFMTFDLKATYGIGAYTPYIEIMNNGNAGAYSPIAFDGSTDFAVAVKPGVTFNVGSCSLDVAFLAEIAKDSFKWSVPFTAGVAF